MKLILQMRNFVCRGNETSAVSQIQDLDSGQHSAGTLTPGSHVSYPLSLYLWWASHIWQREQSFIR